MDWRKSGSGRIAHGPRSVVHGTKKHPRERKRDVVFRLGVRAPLAPLHSANAFAADHVGPRAGHGDLFLPAVKIDEHLALRGFAAHLIVEIDQLLVVALHEIDLDSFDSPLRVLIERWNQLIVERFPYDS